MSRSILRTCRRAGLLAVGAAAAFLAAPLAAEAASATVSATKMLTTLRQAVPDFALREQSASPQIKTTLLQLRQALGPNPKFSVGYTTALDLPLEALAGTRIPQSLPASVVQQVNARGAELLRLDLQSARLKNFDWQKVVLSQCSPSWSAFDWRKNGKVTPVKTQICGTCWDFTAMGAYEGSYAIRNGTLIDTSEQYNLNCHNAGTCAGGWWMPVFDKMIAVGTATEAAYPFTGNDAAACPTGVTPAYKATSWAFVGPDISTIPSVSQIKAALCEHGPLATAVMVDPAFQAYTGGVFDEHTKSFPWINHGVTIIGWDDSKHAWLIKNSWGTGWGETGGYGSERGYMWIDYNTNNIGIATAWVDAKSTRWNMIADYDKLLVAKYKLIPEPGPLKIRQKLLETPAAAQTAPAAPALQPLLKIQPLLRQQQ